MRLLEPIRVSLKKYVKRTFISFCSPYVRRYLQKNEAVKLIGVSGSVGKTSTKFAISKVLRDSGKRVLAHDGAYNDPLASIFVLLEEEYPDVHSPVSICRAFFRVRKASKSSLDYDYVVLEVGTDTPGEMKQLGKFLKLDICVLVAITPEHMVNFKSFDLVAREELEVLKYSRSVLACRDLIPKKYQKIIEASSANVSWYGTASANLASVRAGGLIDVGLNTKREIFVRLSGQEIRVATRLLHLHSGFIISAALVISEILEFKVGATIKSLEGLEPAAGRGRLIAGRKGSIIIDDSYNNVGANVSIASLDLLYEFNTRRRIAVLGGINELSDDLEREAHTQVAIHLNKKKLEEVVIIGRLAKIYYKPVLATNGIKFKYFANPYKAGNYLQNKLVAGMVILVKGSQNGIYSEEAIPPLLQDSTDRKLLVRQSDYWLDKKKKSFGL
ncbi:MAG: UDP-N-acetylmuramoyl-tripeptide--D-alanyl-D-alanine ligase [Patescibacteria group bacterium]|nr:UDP-N-acetylmuramoyl-tripeptide--D-alanyl-D-alanine ligase [Patescibacteria group bacterium]